MFKEWLRTWAILITLNELLHISVGYPSYLGKRIFNKGTVRINRDKSAHVISLLLYLMSELGNFKLRLGKAC